MVLYKAIQESDAYLKYHREFKALTDWYIDEMCVGDRDKAKRIDKVLDRMLDRQIKYSQDKHMSWLERLVFKLGG